MSQGFEEKINRQKEGVGGAGGAGGGGVGGGGGGGGSTQRTTELYWTRCLILICIFYNQNEGSGHLSWHGCQGKGSVFQMFQNGSVRFFGCFFFDWATATRHVWNQTQFIYVLTFFPCIFVKKNLLQTTPHIQNGNDGMFPSISLNPTRLYSKSLTFRTSTKVFSFNAEMLYLQCFSCWTTGNKVHSAHGHHENLRLLVKEGLRYQTCFFLLFLSSAWGLCCPPADFRPTTW